MQRVLLTASQRKAESQEFAKFTSSMERVFTGHSFKSQIVSTINFTSQGALLVQKKPLLEKQRIMITEGREDKQKRLSEANRPKDSMRIAIYTKTYQYINIYLYILSLHLLSHCLVHNAIYSFEVEPYTLSQPKTSRVFVRTLHDIFHTAMWFLLVSCIILYVSANVSPDMVYENMGEN